MKLPFSDRFSLNESSDFSGTPQFCTFSSVALSSLPSDRWTIFSHSSVNSRPVSAFLWEFCINDRNPWRERGRIHSRRASRPWWRRTFWKTAGSRICCRLCTPFDWKHGIFELLAQKMVGKTGKWWEKRRKKSENNIFEIWVTVFLRCMPLFKHWVSERIQQ